MFAQYLSAVWADVVARMSGIASLVFTALGLYSTWFTGNKGIAAAKEYFYIAAIISIALASYKIWADERKKVVSGRPAFQMALEQMFWEYSEPNDNTVFSFAAFVINRGAPSVLHNWRATYSVGEASERMSVMYPQGDWVLRIGKQSLTITKDDLLAGKTLEKRVETGEAKTGRVFFAVAGNRMEQLKSLQFRIEVTCTDFVGQQVTAIFVPDPQPIKGVAVYPGERGGEVLPKQPNDQPLLH